MAATVELSSPSCWSGLGRQLAWPIAAGLLRAAGPHVPGRWPAVRQGKRTDRSRPQHLPEGRLRRVHERTGCLPRANALHASTRPTAVTASVATASHAAESGGTQWGSIWGLPVLDPRHPPAGGLPPAAAAHAPVTASLRPHFGRAVLLSGCQPWPLEGPRTSVHLAKSGVLAEAVVQAGSRWDPGT